MADLTNGAAGHFPFIVSMSCETGYFAYPQFFEAWADPDSLAETFLRSENGPVAALMPTGMTTTGGPYVKLNDTVLTATAYLDTAASPGVGAAVAPAAGLQTGTPYYYVVKSVAADGDASVSSAEVSATATSQVQTESTLSNIPLSGDVGSKACFIQTAEGSTIWDLYED